MGRPQTLHECLPGFGRLVRRFWPYLRKHRPLIAASLLALLASTALRLLEPWPLKFVFDRVIAPKRAHGAFHLAAADALDTSTLLLLSAFAVVAITALRAMAEYLNTVGFAQLGNRVLTEVREDLYRHLQRLSLSYHARARGGDLIVRVVSDVNMLKDVVVTAILPLLANVFIWAGMAGLMIWMQWRLALLALAVLPLFGLAAARTSRRIQETARKQRQREGAMAATAAESIGAIKTVQALCLEERFAADFATRSRQSQKEDVKGRRLSAGLERTVDVLIAVATAIVLWEGARLVRSGLMTAGDLIVFLAYLRRAFNPLQDLAKYTGRLAKGTAAGERIVDLLARAPDVRDLPGALPAPPFHGSVRFENVCFAYDPNPPILSGIDIEIRPRMRVGLVGPSGAGKSTLVNLMLRLHDPARGRVLIDGNDLRSFTLDTLRGQISVVLQETLLFAATVRDNIAQGAWGVTFEQIEAAARLANAHEFISALPEGYGTLIGERGVTLSCGQRQRIAIARAAVRRSPILILDEPTTGLDAESERIVVEALERLAEGATTFLVTHSLHLLAGADLILYLDGGRIAECGTHAELLQVNEKYAAYWHEQAAARERAFRGRPVHALAP